MRALQYPTPTREQARVATLAEARIAQCLARVGQCATMTSPDAVGDAFLTEWENALELRIARAEARVARQGGVECFLGLFTHEGRRLRATLCTHDDAHPNARYVWQLYDRAHRPTRRVLARTPRVLERAGFVEATELAPARVVVRAGNAPDGRTHSWVVVERTDPGYPREALPDA